MNNEQENLVQILKNDNDYVKKLFLKNKLI